MHFGTWIKGRREKLEMTQATLAHRIGVSMATVRNWEHSERMPRLSIPIKAALAEALRMSTLDLDAVGRGEKAAVPFGPLPKGEPQGQPAVPIENYGRGRQFLRGVATTESAVQEGGYLPHKYTPGEVKEFAWIVEDDSMAGVDGYLPGDILVFTESKNIPAGSDVMVEVHGQGLGVVRRVFYQDDRAILTSLNRRYPPQIVSLKDVSRMAMAIALFRAIRTEPETSWRARGRYPSG
jgi:transcriptional regulator with XRE-family HTH domain